MGIEVHVSSCNTTGFSSIQTTGSLAESGLSYNPSTSSIRATYATEAARASLRDAFERVRLKEVLAYTSADNARSRAVIARLNMRRAAALDYSEPLGAGIWHGLVWIARPENGL